MATAKLSNLVARGVPQIRVSAALLSIAVVTFFFLGGSSTRALNTGVRAAPELRIVFWRYHLHGQEDYYRDLAEAFEDANPGHRVVIELEDWNTAHDKIRQWIANGGGPDLTVIPDVWLAEFAPGLDPYTESLPEGFLKDFNPTMLDRSRLNGQVLGLVWAASTKVLFYRTDLFAQAGLQPPSNWQELLTSARKLNRPPEIHGMAIPGAPKLDTADNFYFFLWSNGGELRASDGRPLFDSRESVESLTFLRDLVSKYRVTEPDVETCDRPCAEDLFVRGKAAMVETGPWMIQTIAAQAHPVPFSVVPLPIKTKRATQLVTDHLVLLKGSRAEPEAVQFIKFAYQPSWRLRWARLGMVPELQSVEDDPFFAHDPLWHVFVSELSHARWVPIVKWQPVDAAISHTLGEVFSGRVEPSEGLKSLSRQIRHFLGK
jgi:ABC-type glycerol-3-phosphate transport system substrate-binding protein